MPANIAYTEATGYQAVYVNKPAWHNLGKVVDAALTPEEAIAAAGTGYVVDAAPLFAIINDEAIEVEDHVATYRTDTGDLLGVVSRGYQIIQNITPMQLLMEIVRTKQAGIVAHAALGKGERLFAVLELARLTDLSVPGDPSKIEAFLVAQWWHDGTGALSFGPSTVRVDCQNMANAQLAHAEGRGLLVRIPHLGNVGGAVEEARRILGFAEKRLEDYTGLMRELATIDVPRPEEMWLDGFLTRLVPIPEEMERPVARREAHRLIKDLYWTSPNLDGVPHNAYRVVQAVNEYADHYRPLRVGDASLVPSRRFTSSIDGPAARTKAEAVRLLREEFEVKA
jgi:phage/plasmid-like protein (TIGR03299 family)